jgi:hypothetical protein
LIVIFSETVADIVKTEQIKSHHISIIASISAAVAIGIFFYWKPAWSPAADAQMPYDFAVMWVLLTYMWVQMGTHILFAAATRNQMLLDTLSSILPTLVIAYVLAEYYRGDLAASAYQLNTAWLTAYAMFLDLVLDLSIAISMRRPVQ